MRSPVSALRTRPAGQRRVSSDPCSPHCSGACCVGRMQLHLCKIRTIARSLQELGVPGSKIVLVPGSGVDTKSLQPLPEPDEPITVAFVGRLLHDKGVASLIAAHRLLRERDRPLRLLIAGDADPAKPPT